MLKRVSDPSSKSSAAFSGSLRSARVCVAGCGSWGKNLVRVFSELGTLAAIVEPNSEKLEHAVSSVPADPVSWHDCLTDSGIDAVAIAAPAALHAELTAQALEAGKDVFVEKPLALSMDDGRRLVALAREKSRVLMVGHLLQYHPAFVELKHHVEAGLIGPLKYIHSSRLNLGKIRREEDILWSFAPHDISMILSLAKCGPTQVEASGGYFLNKDIADVTNTYLVFPNQVRAHLQVSWLHPFKEQRLVVVGSDGMLVFDDTLNDELKLRHYPHSIGWQDAMPVIQKADARPLAFDRGEPLRAECMHFLDCVASRQEPCTGGEEGLRVLDVLTRAARALLNNKHPV